MKHRAKRLLLKHFPAVKKDKQLAGEIAAQGQYRSIGAGQALMAEGEMNQELFLVLAGTQRVYKMSEAGREITLYEVGPGQICSLSVSAALAGQPSPANSDALTDLEAVAVEADSFRAWALAHDGLRDFLFSLIAAESAMVMDLIAEVTFKRMDQRLWDYLAAVAGRGKVRATHKKIANDLGTAREVVSRLLKDFERKKMVRLHRGHIEVYGRQPADHAGPAQEKNYLEKI